jgi:RNA polymerase sigma-70 factor (ECF subfamily)|tara:strand:+ start:138 stop:698 length:561 start_codon:yes stop_codon:yes gene_type:complete
MDSFDYNIVIEKAKKNDQKAYNQLFDIYWDSLFNFLLKRTNNKNIAEEIALESFAKAFDNLDSYNSNYDFKNWLFSIAKNHHIDQYRKKNILDKLTSNIDDPVHSDLVSLNKNPEDELINTEKIENILSHIKKLKKDYRILIKLRYFEGMTYKEIEKKIKTPLNTVKVKLFRAKKILIQSIEKNKF